MSVSLNGAVAYSLISNFSLIGLDGLGLAAVTSENTQLQALIQQIDEVLDKTNPRLPWVTSSDAIQQRQVLEQTRSYLRSLQQAAETNSIDETGLISQDLNQDNADINATIEAFDEYSLESEDEFNELSAIAASPVEVSPNNTVADRVDDDTANQTDTESTNQTHHPVDNPAEVQAQQILQAVLQEMSYLRANLLQPLRSDVEALRLQREVLTQEIQQLEQQRQQYGWSSQYSQHLQEFLQAAMAQMQANLTEQVAQVVATLSSQAPNPLQLQGSSAMLSPVERLEQLQRIQAQSDQLMSRLDTTLRLVFESLQTHVHSYGDSLEEGLSRMHDMGQQGEAVFGAFVTRLAQLLGREASAFLQAPTETEWSHDRPSLPTPDNIAPPESLNAGSAADPNTQLHQLLEGLQSLDTSAFQTTVVGEPIPFAGESMQPPELSFDRLPNQTTYTDNTDTTSTDTTDLEIDALDRTLSQIDLSAISSIEAFEMQETSLMNQEQTGFLPSLIDEVEPILTQTGDEHENASTNRDTKDEETSESCLSSHLATNYTTDHVSDRALELLSQAASDSSSFLKADKNLEADIVVPSDANTNTTVFNELNLSSWSITPESTASDVAQPGESWLLRSRKLLPEMPSLSQSVEQETEDEEETEDKREEIDPEPNIRQTRIEQALTDLENDEWRELSSKPICTEMSNEPSNADAGTSIETIALLTDLIPIAENRFEEHRFATNLEQSVADALLESTIEDLFAAIDTEPIDQSSRILHIEDSKFSQKGLLDYSESMSRDNHLRPIDASDLFINAFTLDGLDSLFEGIPSMDADETSPISVNQTDKSELDAVNPQPISEAIDRAESDQAEPDQAELENRVHLNQPTPKLGTIADLTRDLLQNNTDDQPDVSSY